MLHCDITVLSWAQAPFRTARVEGRDSGRGHAAGRGLGKDEGGGDAAEQSTGSHEVIAGFPIMAGGANCLTSKSSGLEGEEWDWGWVAL